MKKLFAMVLALALLVACVPLSAVTVSAATSGTTGDCTWTLDGTHLTISGNGAMADYNYTGGPWGKSITSVTIEDGVTTVGECAFNSCASLTSVSISDSVTTIGWNAFKGCAALSSITIPNSVTSIESMAFYGCSSLSLVIIPNSVTCFSSLMFDGCTSLTRIYFNGTKEQWEVISKPYNWNVNTGAYTVYCIDGQVLKFGEDIEILKASLPEVQTDIDYTYTIISAHSSKCDSSECMLEEYVSDYNNVCAEFYYRKSQINMLDAELCELEKSGEINTQKMNEFNTELERVKDWYYSGRHFMADLAELRANIDSLQCPVTSLVVPDGVVSIGYRKYENNSGITKVTIPNSVIYIDCYAFRGCTALTSIYYNGTVEQWNAISKNRYWNDNTGNYTVYCTDGQVLKVRDVIEALKDGIEALRKKCSEIQTDIDYINTLMSEHASKCDNSACRLVELKSDHNRASAELGYIKSQINMFDAEICELENAEEIDAQKLNEIYTDFEETDDDGEAIEAALAALEQDVRDLRCHLTVVVIPDGDTYISYAEYKYGTGITSVTIPDSVLSIETDAFYGCSKLTSIVIPGSVKTIGRDAFAACSSLAVIIIHSRTAEIYDSANTISDTAAIYGYAGSTAEAYATKYGRIFVALSCDHSLTKEDTTYLASEATCTSAAIYYKSCVYCGKKVTETFEYGAALGHVYDNDCDAQCNECGAIREVGDHKYDAVVTEPDCYTPGYTTYTCSVCGDCYEGDAIAPVHGEIVHVEAKPSTCIEKGHVEYWYCSSCGQVWLAPGCEYPSTIMPLPLPLADHVYDDANDTTCNECGTVRQIAKQILTGGKTSVSEDVNGLAFFFTADVSGAQVKDGYVYVANSASVIPFVDGESYTVVRMGAEVSNGAGTIDIEAKYLWEVTENQCSFAIRIVDIPDGGKDTVVTARPYYVYEVDGEEVVVYGDAVSQTYNAALAAG